MYVEFSAPTQHLINISKYYYVPYHIPVIQHYQCTPAAIHVVVTEQTKF
jgi:hypothetical protein